MSENVSVDELKAEQEKLQEKAERKRLEGMWWAAVLIWAGVVLVADQAGWLPAIGDSTTWSWIFLGGGLFGLIGALVRFNSPTLPNPSTWDVIWAVVFLLIGLGGFLKEDVVFAIGLIVVGLALIINHIFRHD